MSILGRLFGLLLVVSGVVAIYRRRARASAEFEEEREYGAGSAVLLGLLWIALGVAFLLYPDFFL